MTEREVQTPAFKPTATLEDLFKEVIEIGEARPEVGWLQGLNPRLLEHWVSGVCAKTQVQNAQWAEDRFRELRAAKGDWSYDGMWVDEEGKIAGSALWSTYKSYRHGAVLNFSLGDLIASIKRNNRLVYPMGPGNDTVLLWMDHDGDRVSSLLGSSGFEGGVEEYPVDSGFKGELQSAIHIGRVKRGILGPGKFAQKGLVVGNLGFWHNTYRPHGLLGNEQFTERVIFGDSRLITHTSYVSRLSPEEVKERGGTPLDERDNPSPVLRLDPEKGKADFIAATFEGWKEQEQKVLREILDRSQNVLPPLVLRYTTPRLWLDEGPKHG